MKKNEAWRVWLPVVVAALVVALAFATGCLNKQRVFPDIVYSMTFDGEKFNGGGDGRIAWIRVTRMA